MTQKATKRRACPCCGSREPRKVVGRQQTLGGPRWLYECAKCGARYWLGAKTPKPEVVQCWTKKPNEIEINLPTYDGENYDESQTKPIVVRYECGLRIILGKADDKDAPDIFLERHNGHWQIALHPGDGDPTGTIRLQDGETDYEYSPEWGYPDYLLTSRDVEQIARKPVTK